MDIELPDPMGINHLLGVRATQEDDGSIILTAERMTFGGKPGVVIHPGSSVTSDPIGLPLR